MNLRNYLFVLFTFLTFVTYAQSDRSSSTKSECTITEYKIEADNLKELEEIDWDSVYTIFENNDPESNITLLVGFREKLKVRNSSIENWSFNISGKTSELESMIRESKNMVSKFRTSKEN